MCGAASRLTPRFARRSPPVLCIPSMETRCDMMCQVNKIFFPCLQEVESFDANVHAAQFCARLCWHVLTWILM